MFGMSCRYIPKNFSLKSLVIWMETLQQNLCDMPLGLSGMETFLCKLLVDGIDNLNCLDYTSL